MPGTMKSAASRRLFRRHTDTDALDDKSRRSRRKRFIRRGRSSPTSTQSISRFSTFSSNDALEVSSECVSDAASTSDDTVISSTVIDIHEPQHVDVAQPQPHTRDDEVEDCNDCDDFFSRLLEFIPCYPNNEPFEANQIFKDDADSNVMRNCFDVNTMKIECILEQLEEESDEHDPTSHQQDARHLPSTKVSLPPLTEWTQGPLLLVATPGWSNMQIRLIRRVSDPSYFEDPNVHKHNSMNMPNHEAIQLPINNGKEDSLNTWVIDFETNIFAGTALFRIRDSSGWIDQNSTTPVNSERKSAERDYFGKHSRKFQMIIRGKFKSNVIMADCMSGLLLDRHIATSSSPNINCVDDLACPPTPDTESKDSRATLNSKRSRRLKRSKSPTDDSLPSKWVLRAAVKAAGVFSPRMDADLECSRPRILSPLCSAAQTVSVSRKNSAADASIRLDETHAEPSPSSDASLVHDLNNSTKKTDGPASNFVQQRKRAFDAAYDARVASLTKVAGECNASKCFDTDSEYTFEFLQHLVNYNDLSLDLGKIVGKLKLGGGIRGQPVRFICAAVNRRGSKATSASDQLLSMDDLDCLWSFDLWHSSLLPERA